MKAIQSLHPYSQKLHYQGVFFSSESLSRSVAEGFRVSQAQSRPSLQERVKCVVALKNILEKDKKVLAELIALEMGKTLREALAEVEKCADLCSFYAEHAEKWLKPKVVSTEKDIEKRIEYHSMGLILGIMPWNFPFWQVFRFAIPSLLVGNAVLLKHAPNVPLCALKLHELFEAAGFEPGTYQNLFISEEQVADVLSDPRLRGVSLTGSEKAGRSVAELAGRSLKKQVLELGGSDPFLIMPSASLNEAVDWAVKARLICNGQSCIAAKRFIVHEEVYEAFLTLLKEKLKALTFGDPLDAKVSIGPLARVDLADQLRTQVRAAIDAGATLEAEYFFETQNPCFVPVSIVTNIQNNNPLYHQEVFGPVFSVYKIKTKEEGLNLANATSFGLGASVWTTDTEEQEFFIAQLEAGSVFVNAMVSSMAALPFGGVKNSGYGRELAEEGLKEFCNVKSIVVASAK